MKKVLVYGLYDWNNLGDDFMMYCINATLKNHNIEPVFIKADNANYFKEEYEYDKVLATQKLSDNKLINALLKIKQLMQFKKIANKYDSVIFMGGGYINRYIGSGYFKLIYIYLLKKAFKNKKVFFTGQTVGPFKNWLDKILIKKIYKNSTYISVRENKSKEYLDNLGIKCELTGDDACLIKNILTPNKINDDFIIVNYKLFNGYENNFDSFCEWLYESLKYKKIKVYVLPFRNNDRYEEYKYHAKLNKYLKDNNIDSEILNINNVLELITYINSANMIIGTAYHAVTLGIIYDKKIITGYIGEYYKNKIKGVVNVNDYQNVQYFNMNDLNKFKIEEKKFKSNINVKKKNVETRVIDSWEKICTSINMEE